MFLAVTALGFLGVVASQLIQTWRENQRAQLDVRRQHHAHWLDQRVDAYSAFFAAAQDWRAEADKITLSNVRQPTSTSSAILRERCESARTKARTELARIELFGSKPVIEHAHHVYGFLHTWSVDALNGLLPSASTSGPCRDLVAGDEVIEGLRQAIRTDLGLGGGGDAAEGTGRGEISLSEKEIPSAPAAEDLTMTAS